MFDELSLYSTLLVLFTTLVSKVACIRSRLFEIPTFSDEDIAFILDHLCVS